MDQAGTDSVARLKQVFALQHSASRSNPPRPVKARQAGLRLLQHAIQDRQDRIVAAISADFGHRSGHESRILEIFTVLEAIRSARRNLWLWTRPEFRPVSIFYYPSINRIVHQPLGVIGIVSPFNFPLLLSIGPLVAALAAGNRAMIKTSELSPDSSAEIAEILAAVFNPDEVALVTGDEEVSKEFCSLPFDHLFFTGSTRTGKLVMQAAAAGLTPVTLELGGKNPVVFDDNLNWPAMVKRTLVGKTLNAGQTCVAPDYVLLPEGREELFCKLAQAAVSELYPTLLHNPDYSSIASDLHYRRLAGLLDDARRRGATLVELNPLGEDLPPSSRKLAPVIVLNAAAEAELCEEEIFGPVLPVFTYRSTDEAIEYINRRPRPLALYCFSRRRQFINEIVSRTASGSVGLNTTVRHAGQDDLPFGGVGQSGFGRYHGRDGFLLFSNRRGVMYEGTFTSFTLFYPPYRRTVDMLLKLMLGWRR